MALTAAHVSGDSGHTSDHNLIDTALAGKLDASTAATTYNPKSTQGLFASRPAAGTAGKRYYATDLDKEYLDDGTAWHEILTATAGSAVYVSFAEGTATGTAIENIGGVNEVHIGSSLNRTEDAATGNIFYLASFVKNYGTRATVALFGMGKGKHVWGANLVGYTDGADHTAIGCEIDFGNLNAAAGGQAYGLLLRSLGGNVGGQGGVNYIQFQAAASSSCSDGILFNPSAGVPAVASTGALIKAAGENCAIGINFSGSKFTTGTLNLPVNSGSTTASIGLIFTAEGGFANTGAFIDMRASGTGSSVSNGIVFRLSGTVQPITGALIRTSGGTLTAVTGIDFSGATFSTAAFNVGDNNIVVGTTTGTKIGTATTQKLGFFAKTPVVQPSGTPVAATDLTTVIALANSLRTNLLALGLVA